VTQIQSYSATKAEIASGGVRAQTRKPVLWLISECIPSPKKDHTV